MSLGSCVISQAKLCTSNGLQRWSPKHKTNGKGHIHPQNSFFRIGICIPSPSVSHHYVDPGFHLFDTWPRPRLDRMCSTFNCVDVGPETVSSNMGSLHSTHGSTYDESSSRDHSLGVSSDTCWMPFSKKSQTKLLIPGVWHKQICELRPTQNWQSNFV